MLLHGVNEGIDITAHTVTYLAKRLKRHRYEEGKQEISNFHEPKISIHDLRDKHVSATINLSPLFPKIRGNNICHILCNKK